MESRGARPADHSSRQSRGSAEHEDGLSARLRKFKTMTLERELKEGMLPSVLRGDLVGNIRRQRSCAWNRDCMCQKFVSGEMNSTPIYCLPSRARGSRQPGTPSTARCCHSSGSAYAPPIRSLRAEIRLRGGSPTVNRSVRRTSRQNLSFRARSMAPLTLPAAYGDVLCNESEAETFALRPQNWFLNPLRFRPTSIDRCSPTEPCQQGAKAKRQENGSD